MVSWVHACGSPPCFPFAIRLDVDRPLRLSEPELKALASRGTIGPSIGRGLGNELVDRAASGVKPATLRVSAAAAAHAVDLGLVVKAVETVDGGAVFDFVPWLEATGEFAPNHPGNGERVLYAAAVTPEAKDRLEAAYSASMRAGPEGLRGGVELGFALGYSAADVAAWLVRARLLAECKAAVDG